MKKDNNKFKITMPQLQKIIKEEYAIMKEKVEKAKEINERIDKINEELETLPEIVSEVEASGTKKVKSTGWTGEGNGDVKFGEKFEKKGTHLKEDDEIEGEIELGGEEMEGPEMEGPEMGYFEMKFAELGKELDSKLEEEEEEEEEEEMEEEEEEEEEMEGNMEGNMEGDEGEVVAESVEVVEEVIEDTNEEDETVSEMEETKLEPIEGDSPIQDSDARFNDYMEKDKHVSEGTKKIGTTLLSEGFTPERKSKIDAELARMKKLAKI